MGRWPRCSGRLRLGWRRWLCGLRRLLAQVARVVGSLTRKSLAGPKISLQLCSPTKRKNYQFSSSTRYLWRVPGLKNASHLPSTSVVNFSSICSPFPLTEIRDTLAAVLPYCLVFLFGCFLVAVTVEGHHGDQKASRNIR